VSIAVNASPEAVIELTKDINQCLKSLNALNEELTRNLRSLGTSFQDEGFLIIQNYIERTKQMVDQSVPDLGRVMNSLVEMARLLTEARKQTSS
jgi:ABC-type transporter Mla subunit MlaD